VEAVECHGGLRLFSLIPFWQAAPSMAAAPNHFPRFPGSLQNGFRASSLLPSPARIGSHVSMPMTAAINLCLFPMQIPPIPMLVAPLSMFREKPL
jgi:hypothetical protein